MGKQKLLKYKAFNLIRIIILVFPFIFGWIGFYNEKMSLVDAAYSSIQMYGMNIDAVADGAAYNTFIEIGRWSAPVVTFLIGFSIIVDIVKGDLWPRIFCKLPEHCAVYGDPEEIQKLCPDAFKMFSKYWYVQDEEYVRCKKYILLFDSDAKNLKFYSDNLEPITKTYNNVRIYMKVSEIDTQDIQDLNLVTFQTNSYIAREFFRNPDWARKMYTKVSKGNHDCKIAIVGFGNLGCNMLEKALILNLVSVYQHMEYHIWGNTEEYGFRFKNLKDTLLDPDKIIYRGDSWKEDIKGLEDMDVIIICGEPDENIVTLSNILKMTNVAGNENCDVYVYCENEAVLKLMQIKTFKVSPNSYSPFLLGDRLHAFSYDEDDLIDKLISYRDALYLEGKQKHKEYKDAESKKGNKVYEWEELNSFLRWDNQRSADMDDIRKILDEFCTPNTTQALEHISWERGHFLNGWRYDSKRNDALKRHHNLKDYKLLDQEERMKDDNRIK